MSKQLKPIHLLQDNARESLDTDLLSMGAWIDVIAGSAIGNDGPFTIGIYKEWGYGKTTLLRLARQRVQESEPDPSGALVTVWFNAWQFEREEHPLFPLIAAITDAIEKAVGDDPAGKQTRLKKIGLSLRALTRGMKLKAEAGVPLLGNVGVEFDAQKALEAEELLGKETNPLQAESLYHAAFEMLGKVAGGGAKIVVFVDDLDRCNPSNAVRLLENIKLVLAQKGFVFVLALDHVVIETYLDTVYEERYGFKKGTGRGRRYLEKIIQLPLEIPSHEKRFSKYVDLLIEELAEKYKDKGAEDAAEDIKIGALGVVKDVLAAHVGHNPRRLVRLIDSFLIDTFLWEGTSELRTSSKFKKLDKDVANAIAIHRVVHSALGEALTRVLIDDKELRTRLFEYPHGDGPFGDGSPPEDVEGEKGVMPERAGADGAGANGAGAKKGMAATPLDKLVQELWRVPDIVGLLQSEAAKALVKPGEEDLWAAVLHFMTTARTESFVTFPDFLDGLIREQLKLGKDDPIPVSRLSEVKSLDLEGEAQVTDAGLVHLKGLAGLRKLSLSGTQLTDTGLVHLKGLTSLQWLDLCSTQVSDTGLVHLKGLAGLQILWLSDTQVTDAGLVHLKGLTGLQTLRLNNLQVTDAGLVHLMGHTGLRRLSLDRTQVTDAGLVHLKALTGLRELRLNGTQVTDAGREHLKELTWLRALLLEDTRVTEVGLAELRQALRGCEIYGP